jgi:adenine deaminase
VTVNSDDPAYFGGYVLENFSRSSKDSRLSKADLNALARNSFEASFLPEAAKRRWMQSIDAYASDAD